jgi:hypothetical protein
MSTVPIIKLEPSDNSRFWAMVDKRPDFEEIEPGVGGCWEWNGCLTLDGYGKFSANGQTLRAHRVSNTLEFGPMKRGVMVLHMCDNRKCVRPSHHVRGTARDNNEDKLTKLRGDWLKRHGNY